MALADLPIFPFRPDWSEAVRERLAWTTDAMTSRNAAQATRMLTSQAPRRYLTFALAVQDAEHQYFNALAHRYGRSEWWLPIWTDGVPLDADLGAASTSVPVDPTDRDFSDGGAVVLLGPGAREVELVEVDTVGGSDVTLAAGTAAAWPAGTLVLPARKARVPEGIAQNAFDHRSGYGSLAWRITEPCAFAEDDGAASYRGFPVLTERPVTQRDLEHALQPAAEAVELGMGPVAVFDWAGIPLPTQAHDWSLDGRAAIAAFRSLLYALQGRARSIWVPTWQSDLSVVSSLGSGSTALRVAWCGYTDQLFDVCNRKDLRIELHDGSVFYRRVTAASEISGTVEELTLSSALGVAIDPADVLQVSYLALCRSESDFFDLNWWTGDYVDVTTAWRGRNHDL